MALFNRKVIERSKTLGERLRKVRQEANVSLEDAEAATQIRKQYLAAIEAGDYSLLPGPVYIEKFLKRYAEFLKVSSDFVLDLYHQQDKKVLKKRYHPDYALPSRTVRRAFITPQVVRLLAICIVIAACLAYLIFEIGNIFSPPRLTVDSPPDATTVAQDSIEVRGTTEPEVTVLINGQQVFLDEDGNFSETVTLKEGLNVITVSAAKKRSKPTTVLRHVLLEKKTP